MKKLKIFSIYLFGLFSGLLSAFFINDFTFFKPFFEMLLIGLIAALLSFLLDFCFREGNIFAFWIRFLNKYFYKNKKNPFSFLYKPLGACTICMNIYVANFVFLFYWFFWPISWIWFFPAMLASHFILFFTFKHFDIES